ncbi:MAG: endonuclease/exonuclease/phosphatase family protein [FCB group bacterium]|nr:endonuclease/exonuclease/phosphatase family protein [FCB group bacterium]MBL7028275.1 endonuclease/exonuclease/phosphatase family protein [Candidatus Neomarinimicrobiota bacterium]
MNISLGLMLLSCSPNDPSETNLAVMTFNIRLNLASDGDNAWPNRKDMAASMIRYNEPDIFGVQEAFRGQVNDLSERLPEYAWIGAGRDDGKQAGEYMAIFYQKSRLKLLHEETFWLNEHPHSPGLGWDAAYNRVVTWGQFKDLKTGQTLFHFNTHFDNRGEVARQESAKLLLSKIQSIAGSSALVVTGDFNTYPDSEPYRILTGSELLTDAKTLTQTPHHGPRRTFNGFDLESLKTTEPPIDYIFVSKDIVVLKHATLSDTFGGYFPSDHMPVLATITIKP